MSTADEIRLRAEGMYQAFSKKYGQRLEGIQRKIFDLYVTTPTGDQFNAAFIKGRHLGVPWVEAVYRDYWANKPTVNARFLVSRNKREGLYAGHPWGRHLRASSYQQMFDAVEPLKNFKKRTL